jgi:hypothetical protein
MIKPMNSCGQAAATDVTPTTRPSWRLPAFRGLPCSLLAALVCASAPAGAAEFVATGKVQKIFALDTSAYGDSSILVDGLASAGSCPRNDGLVSLVLRDDNGGKRQLAVALSAKLAGMPVVVRVDEGFKNARGHCYLAYLELN